MSENALKDYYSALERIKKGCPNIVPKGSKINNDAISLEAGRGKGSIKRSRAIFVDLIQAIEDAAKDRAHPNNEQKDRLLKVKSKADQYRRELEASLAREISLLYELFETKKTIALLTGDKILPLRGNINEPNPIR